MYVGLLIPTQYKGTLFHSRELESSNYWNLSTSKNSRNGIKSIEMEQFHASIPKTNERKEFMQETQHTQQTATRRAQNQDKETT